MELYNQNYYHFYNRTNNNELAFREQRNYFYFLKKYRKYMAPYVKTHAYCLMPTHFHFLIQIQTQHIAELAKNIGVFLSSYAKAINHAHHRHGSLFQQHSQAKLVDDERYLLSLLNYIHQNPIRRAVVQQMEAWPFSSYLDLAGMRDGTLVTREIVNVYFPNKEDFVEYSQVLMTEVNSKYWITK